MSELNKQIAEHIFQQTDFSHLSWVYEEGWLESGDDGWSGFVCPRCGATEGDEGICVKDYANNIALAYEAEEVYRSNGLSLDSYVSSLSSIVESNPYLVPDEWYLIHASAKERCLALLKSIGVTVT